MSAFDQTVTPAADTSSERDHVLRGNLNTFKLLFAVLAFNGPIAGVISFLPLVIAYGNGVGAPAVFVAAGILVALFSVGFLKMSRHIDNPGGFYSYVTKGLGREVGLGSAFLAIVTYGLIFIAIFPLEGIYLQKLVHDTFNGPDVSWKWYALLTVVVVAVFGYFNVEFSARALTIAMALEGAMIIVYDVSVLLRGGAHGLSMHSFTPHNMFSGNVGIGLLFAMLCFSGFEVTAIFRDEVKNPNKTIPRAAYLFIAIIGIGYAVSVWVLIQAVGEKSVIAQTQADPTGTALASVRTFSGTLAVDLVTVLICTGAFASVLAGHNVLARYIFNLGVDGIFPKALGKVHPRHGSPSLGSVVMTTVALASVLIMIAMNANPLTVYAPLTGGNGYGLILVLFVTTIAILAFMFRTKPEDTNAWHRLVAPSLALVGLGVGLWLASKNIEVLVPNGGGAVAAMLTLVYGVFVAGIVWALVLKKIRPASYAKIGRQ
ncbi:APC family permease [Streptomyces antnestii]|uniref:APC family permease n=1 Tax=Streptomyces antnestii TaxID=2494256 RepID=A0A3S2VLR9_9ACTN|nr:APC family permease [Streptomyces sp. San01]RVU29027.1 APC family permease [Streptomyces sp. San01]